MWVVGIGMYLLIVFFLWLNEKRFNKRWLDLAAGSFLGGLENEEENRRLPAGSYVISWPAEYGR